MTWFKNNSYLIVKMIINQFGLAIMGILLIAFAQTRPQLMFFASLYTTLFYLILLYMMTWDLGAKDRIRADAGMARLDYLHGLKLSLFANIPNLLLFLLLFVGFLFGSQLGEAAWAQTMYVWAHGIATIWESMYTGFIVSALPSATTSSLSGYYAVAYGLAVLPAPVTCTVGYIFGARNRRIFGSLLAPKKR